MNSLKLEVGQRVLDTDCRRKYREAVILRLSVPQPKRNDWDADNPEYALVRYDAWWKSDAWVSTHYLNPIESVVPAAQPEER